MKEFAKKIATPAKSGAKLVTVVPSILKLYPSSTDAERAAFNIVFVSLGLITCMAAGIASAILTHQWLLLTAMAVSTTVQRLVPKFIGRDPLLVVMMFATFCHVGVNIASVFVYILPLVLLVLMFGYTATTLEEVQKTEKQDLKRENQRLKDANKRLSDHILTLTRNV